MRRILSFALTAVAVLVVIQFAPTLGNVVGENFAADLRERHGILTEEEKQAAIKEAAADSFVPAVRKRHPLLVKGVPDRRIAQIATYTCIVFDDYYSTPGYQTKVRRRTAARLTQPTQAQVATVIGLAARTTCPDHEFLAAQFQ